MEERDRQHPTIITTNPGYDEWPNFLANRPMVEALLSRLRHYITAAPCSSTTFFGSANCAAGARLR